MILRFQNKDHALNPLACMPPQSCNNNDNRKKRRRLCRRPWCSPARRCSSRNCMCALAARLGLPRRLGQGRRARALPAPPSWVPDAPPARAGGARRPGCLGGSSTACVQQGGGRTAPPVCFPDPRTPGRGARRAAVARRGHRAAAKEGGGGAARRSSPRESTWFALCFS